MKNHWPEYLMEAAGLGLFMISACGFATWLGQTLPDPLLNRVAMGLAMGLTAVALIYSPWGKQSGAHFNPAVTLTFLRLGKITPADAVCYVVAQFAGGLAGVLIATSVGHSVDYAITVPGPHGCVVAFASELIISFVLMWVVLRVSNTPRFTKFTGLFAGALVAIYIVFESPLSGMSMNPARSFGSAVPAHTWTGLWIYFVAPPLGMLLAGEFFSRSPKLACPKLHHQNSQRCIFCGKQAT